MRMHSYNHNLFKHYTILIYTILFYKYLYCTLFVMMINDNNNFLDVIYIAQWAATQLDKSVNLIFITIVVL